MSDLRRTIQLGRVTITVINVGNIHRALSEWIDEPPGGWSADHSSRMKQVQRFPTYCIHIASPGVSVLVDAGVSADPAPSAEPVQQLPTLLEQLSAIDARHDDIRHVVITHTHWDHFNGTAANGQPAVPMARHHVGRGDWESANVQEGLKNPQSLESRTLGVVQRAGLLDLETGNRALAEGIEIIAAPGETAGHQMVRVHSEGQTLYCVGDLYHHVFEVEQPTLMVRWADAGMMRGSREALTAAALAENALLVATHIPTVGRLRRTATGVEWAEAG